MSEQDMIDAKYSETRRNNIKMDCQLHVAEGWIRLDGFTESFFRFVVIFTEIANKSKLCICPV